MQESNPKPLEENLDMANYIMLHRIYDVLLLLSNKIVGSEETEKMSKYHEEGYLLGPSPSFRSENDV
jgi:hypothetical protein